jgi:hypothetical protein
VNAPVGWILCIAIWATVIVSFVWLPNREPTRSFTDAQLRAFVTHQADCHAEFISTHPGLGITEAVRACFPGKE